MEISTDFSVLWLQPNACVCIFHSCSFSACSLASVYEKYTLKLKRGQRLDAVGGNRKCKLVHRFLEQTVIPSSIVAMIHMNTILDFCAPTFPFFNFNVSLCLPASTRVNGMKTNLLLMSCLICCIQMVGLDDLNVFFQPQCDSREVLCHICCVSPSLFWHEEEMGAKPRHGEMSSFLKVVVQVSSPATSHPLCQEGGKPGESSAWTVAKATKQVFGLFSLLSAGGWRGKW